MALYDIQALNFTYPSQKESALKNIDFSLDEGEFVTICGLSGSGKSTLLRNLKTALAPHGKKEGIIFYKNDHLSDVSELIQAKEIGFVMQSPDNQTITDKVWQELAFGLENMGVKRDEIKRKIAEMTACFDMYDWIDKRLCELSGGQKQILNLACVMLLQPEVLILDEPVSGLDTIAAQEFMQMLTKINHEFGTAVILCDHSLEYAFSVSDRIIVMERGEIISDNTPSKTSEFLWQTKNPLFNALPIGAKIHYLAGGKPEGVPYDISSGRISLKKLISGKELKPVIHKEYEYNKDDIAVSVRNIYYRYSRNTGDIFRGLSFYAYYGSVTAILGANGTGKTTLLKNILGIIKPYIGKISLNKNSEKNPTLAYFPQDPRALFIADTLEKDLREITNDDEAIENALELFGLMKLKDHHPYDLSGGEQHKAALAKLLLKKPDILLLDEPVNGADVRTKRDIGLILRQLCERGICIILISHDMDFCAEYADRCTQIFDGEIFDTVSPHIFFSENMFFTTSARRLARNIIDEAVTENEIKTSLGIKKIYDDNSGTKDRLKNIYDERTAKSTKKNSSAVLSIITGTMFILSALAFLGLGGIALTGNTDTVPGYIAGITAIISLVSGMILGRKEKRIEISKIKRNGKGIIISLIVMFAAVPVTIFIGIKFLNDSRYLFISLLIMLECMVSFTFIFEKQKIPTREIVLICVMCALCVMSRAAFFMFPQFKPVTAMIIITGAALGAETGFIVGAGTMLMSNMIFGQGPWTPWQMFTMGLIGFISGVFFGIDRIPKTKYTFCLFGFFAALVIYGGIMDPAALIMSHIELTLDSAAAYYIAGFPLDLIHAVSTSVFLFLASSGFIKKLERIKKKYGLTHERQLSFNN